MGGSFRSYHLGVVSARTQLGEGSWFLAARVEPAPSMSVSRARKVSRHLQTPQPIHAAV